MKKPLKALLLLLGILLVLYVAARVTGVFQFYRTPTTSMEPTLKMKSYFFASNLKKPKRNDIIVFSRVLTEKDRFDSAGKKLTFTYRLIAFGGEVLEIKKGYAYVDGQLVDGNTNLKFPYYMSVKDQVNVNSVLGWDEEDAFETNHRYQENGDSIILELSLKEYIKVINTASLRRYVPNLSNDLYGNDSSKKWTVSNYGPIKIPQDYYFVLGDNRYAAADSRYVGPIPKKNLKGVVLWK